MSEKVVLDKDSQAIVDAILRIARDRAEAIKKEAQKRAQEILERAKLEAEEILRSRREKAEREIREELARRRSAAEVEAAQIVLRTKAEIINELFERVRDRLEAIAEGKDEKWNYKEVLVNLALEGAKALGEKEVVLMGREKDRKLLEEVAKELSSKGIKASVDEKSIPITGGLVVRDLADSKRFYNTFDGRLRAYREEKEVELLEKLFPKGDETVIY